MIDIDLKKIREQLNLSESQFAKSAGVTRQNINEYEKGDRKFSLDKKIQMLEKLGFTVELKIKKKKDNK